MSTNTTSNNTSSNITWHHGTMTQEEREQHIGKGCVLWFTGLSGSGKSTVARAVEDHLLRQATSAFVLDGDNLRFGLNADLDFSEASRQENVRRSGEVSILLYQANVIVLAAFISPFQADRDKIRAKLPEGRFIEVYVSTSLDECAKRDPKGLYAKALKGEIANFTGISSPYEVPTHPELTIDTSQQSIEDSVKTVVDYLRDHQLL